MPMIELRKKFNDNIKKNHPNDQTLHRIQMRKLPARSMPRVVDEHSDSSMPDFNLIKFLKKPARVLDNKVIPLRQALKMVKTDPVKLPQTTRMCLRENDKSI